MRRLMFLIALTGLAITGHAGRHAPVSAQPVAAVRVADFEFQPGTVTVPPGTVVTWTHVGGASHTVTADDRAYHSGTLRTGQNFAFRFETAGTFRYHCEIHSQMVGTVVVQAGAPAPTAVAAPPTPAPVTTATPAAAAPGGEAGGPLGTLSFADGQARSDLVRLDVRNLRPQQGTTITAWLAAANGDAARLGTLAPDGSGRATLSYTDQQRRNLIALFDRAIVTAETGSGGDKPAGRELLRDEVSPPAMVHIRHLVVRFDQMPQGTPLATGMLGQTAVAADHGNLAKLAVQANDLAGARLHLEHIVNIIEGTNGPNFGDRNGDGRRDNPGDGIGVFTYASSAAHHAQLGMEAAPRDETIKLHGGQVVISTQNVAQWTTEALGIALLASSAPTVEALREPVNRVADLLQNALEGRDANCDGRIDPVPGEGGARAGYIQSQLMASMAPSAARVAPAPAPAPAASTPAAATTPQAAAASPAAAATQAAAATTAPAPVTTAASDDEDGSPLLVIAIVGTAALLAALGVGAWAMTRRRGAGPG